MYNKCYLYVGVVLACSAVVYKYYETTFGLLLGPSSAGLLHGLLAASRNSNDNNNNLPLVPPPSPLLDEATLHARLLMLERQASRARRAAAAAADSKRLRVAVGFGSCKDRFIRAAEFFKAFGTDHANTKLAHYDQIDSRQQLEEMFLFFFTKGIAAERYVSNETLFAEILAVVNEYQLSVKDALGGNAPVMASRFAKEDTDVYLGSVINTQLHRLANVDPRIRVLNDDDDEDGGGGGSSSSRGSDVHILMEYDTTDRVGRHQSPRANRFIVHSDQRNPYLSVMERFFGDLGAFEPDVIVIGGMQMMDNFPFKSDDEMKSRLVSLGKCLSQPLASSRPASATSSLVHFELASFTDQQLMKHLTEQVINTSDSLGMNEQELANLYSFLAAGQVSLAEDAYVGIDVALHKIRYVFSALESRPRSRILTRLHLHTVLFQLLVIRRFDDSTEDDRWRNPELAVARSSLMATKHACQMESVDLSKVRLEFRGPITLRSGERIELTSEKPIASWRETVEVDGPAGDAIVLDFYVAPVLICTDVKQTTGGGDNISPVGLVSQLLSVDSGNADQRCSG